MQDFHLCFGSTEGFKEAAEKFRMESGIEPSVDLDSLDERIKIREMILKGQIQDAIALINSLHPELLDTNRYLYFHLQVNYNELPTIVSTSRSCASDDIASTCTFVIYSPCCVFLVCSSSI